MKKICSNLRIIFQYSFLALACFGLAMPAWSACIFNPEANAIWVYDYSETMPCRLRQLFFADQVNNWGRVSYDRATDTYTVNANLWIGRNNGSDTFFQLGASNHPAETLVLNGNLVIYPTFIRGENNKSQPEPRTHRLTIGSASNDAVCPKLLFQNEAGTKHTLHAGAYYRGDKMEGGVLTSGQLHMHNGMISAAIPDRQHAIPGHLLMYLEEFVMQGGTISWVNGTIGYGMGEKSVQITGGVFEHSGTAFGWGGQAMRGVTFRNIGLVFGDSERYPLNAALTECRFESNDVNWALTSGRIYCVDCEIKPPIKGNHFGARKDAPPDRIRVVSSRHVIVEVKNAKGQPVKDAAVQADCEQDAKIRRAAVTGADGRTPDRDEPKALLLDEWEERATAVENKPERRDFSYTIQVTPRKGEAFKQTGLRPQKSWEIIPITLP